MKEVLGRCLGRRKTWPRWIFAFFSLSHLSLCRCISTEELYSRSLQAITTSNSKTITVRFSIWFPQYTDVSDFSALNDPESSVQQGVIAALFTLLCNEADVSVVRNNNQDDMASQSNLCLTKFQSQPRLLQTTEGMSIISSEPELLVRRISGDTFSWSTWIMRFGIFQIGSSYYEKSLSENPNGTFSELEDASVETMEEAFQLMIDNSILSGQFDEILASVFDGSVQVFSSLIRNEEETFQDVKSRLFQTPPYNPKTFSAMRFSGLILFILTETTLFVLYILAKRRRKSIDRNDQAESCTPVKSIRVEHSAMHGVEFECTRTPSTVDRSVR